MVALMGLNRVIRNFVLKQNVKIKLISKELVLLILSITPPFGLKSTQRLNFVPKNG